MTRMLAVIGTSVAFGNVIANAMFGNGDVRLFTLGMAVVILGGVVVNLTPSPKE